MGNIILKSIRFPGLDDTYYIDSGHTPIITAEKINKTTIILVDNQPIAEINDGDDGQSPLITSTRINKTTIIYANHQQVARIQDGEDYALTPEDKEQIVDLIKEEIIIPKNVSELYNDIGYIVDPTDYITNSEMEELLK